ncbi:MAG: endopeptidase La [Lachnobacterium sp.]|nr:endopeptidase La [Lachnobacterium sp.]
MRDEIRMLPAVALRGITILPGMIAHFDISREVSIKAVERAMKDGDSIFLVTQKDTNKENPEIEDLQSIGVIAEIKQVVRLQNDIIRVMVEGEQRAEVYEIAQDQQDYLKARVIAYIEEDEKHLPAQAEEAMVMSVQETFAKYSAVQGRIGKEVVRQVQETTDLSKLLDYVGNNLPVNYDKKQKILDAIAITERYEVLLAMLLQQIEVLAIKSDFQKKVQERVEKHQKEYVLREQMALIREELGETNTDSDALEYEKKLEELQASDEVKKRIKKEIQRFRGIAGNSSESTVSRGYIETLLELPWDKTSVDNQDLTHAQEILDEDHYGLEKVKERVIEFLAVRNLTGKGESPILCLVGPPGTGKTSIARSIARALDKKYVRISLGGVRDEAEIRGHRRTYVGALPGRIVSGLRTAGVKNPLMLLDEIDKMSSDYKGDTASALLEVLDAEQNSKFRDHYVELPVDLSEVLFIASANSLSDIPGPLRDRMEIIEVSSYTENEKLHIAKDHLIAKQLKKNGVNEKQLKINDKALREVIAFYTREAGVRGLERRLGEICRKAARRIYEGETEKIRVSGNNLEEFLGKPKYREDKKNKKDEIGIVRGLAWTSVGGVTLEIEVNVLPGKGELVLTGKLGDVMKESARAGISYIRSISSDYGIDPEFFTKHDIHVHIPEGAVPKDGPSAGITMALAILSAITERPVRADIAMTGEITIRGRVLPIGGLKEKLLAAKNAGMKTVCIPKDNERDLSELSEEITEGMEILPIDHMNQLIKAAFV